jgi:8-oxo-dGTP pyrophosphatase MutT (NUDIX family)
MLDIDVNRTGPEARDAATLVVLREVGSERRLEVFCVERHPRSGFLGGAIVFPGGKVDPSDLGPEWDAAAVGASSADRGDRAQRIAACREALEEAAILPLRGGALSHPELLAIRARAAANERSLRDSLLARGLRLDLDALHPFARWITPMAETRRFDTRFYLTVLPTGQEGAHDNRETTSSFWASPADVLARFDEGRVQLLPPTHRTLELLAAVKSSAEAIALAATMSLDPICPRVVAEGETLALTLPGDPAHEVREVRVAGRSRFVLRDGRWLPEDAPK